MILRLKLVEYVASKNWRLKPNCWNLPIPLFSQKRSKIVWHIKRCQFESQSIWDFTIQVFLVENNEYVNVLGANEQQPTWIQNVSKKWIFNIVCLEKSNHWWHHWHLWNVLEMSQNLGESMFHDDDVEHSQDYFQHWHSHSKQQHTFQVNSAFPDQTTIKTKFPIVFSRIFYLCLHFDLTCFNFDGNFLIYKIAEKTGINWFSSCRWNYLKIKSRLSNTFYYQRISSSTWHSDRYEKEKQLITSFHGNTNMCLQLTQKLKIVDNFSFLVVFLMVLGPR